MKTRLKIGNWHKITLTAGFVATALLLSFCGGAKTDNNKSASETVSQNEEKLDTVLDKYCGLYAWGENTSRPGYFSIGIFPENSKIHLTDVKEDGKRLYFKDVTIEKSFVGKCFYVDGAGAYDTKRISQTVGGYVAPEQGNIILGVDKAGNIHIQNYNHSSKTGGNDNPFFNLGGTGTYGKFILRPDGKYNISVKNVIYEYKKGV